MKMFQEYNAPRQVQEVNSRRVLGWPKLKFGAGAEKPKLIEKHMREIQGHMTTT